MKVVVTGAAGSIGTALRQGLPAYGWTVVPVDREPLDDAGAVTGDVADPVVLDRALDGASGVVHLAGIPTEAPLPEILDSHVLTTRAVLDACRRRGVRRAVLASSNHAVGFTPRQPLVGVGTRPRPDTFYGVGKVAMEALGSLYADRYGLEVVALRIGSFGDRPHSRWELSAWLSPGDACRLVDAALRAPGLTYDVVYGISGNTRAWWDLAPARALGYAPQDDAEAWAADVDAGPVDPDDPEERFLGGEFTGPGYDDGRTP